MGKDARALNFEHLPACLRLASSVLWLTSSLPFAAAQATQRVTMTDSRGRRERGKTEAKGGNNKKGGLKGGARGLAGGGREGESDKTAYTKWTKEGRAKMG